MTARTEVNPLPYQLETAPGFEHFDTFLLSLPERFHQQGAVMHDGRNRVKVIEVDGTPVVVKSFQQLGLLRRLIYTFIRPPKAERSYRNARKLQAMGIETATPVGYVQFYRHGILADSYFVALEVAHDYPVGKVIHFLEQVASGELEAGGEHLHRMRRILEQCADFTADMHSKGVLHLDYSKGNLLIRESGNDTGLAVIDVNRMVFGPVSAQASAENLLRLLKTSSVQQVFIPRYAARRQLDEQVMTASVRRAVARHERFRRWRHRLKDMLGLRRG